MQLTFVLTHRCNLACSYCYAGEKFNRTMAFDTAMRALRTASGTEALTIGFFGGEPMLAWPLLVRIARVARHLAWRQQRPLRFTITTNGTILEEQHLRFFYTYNFEVVISVDGLGPANRHRPMVSGESSAPKVWRNLQRAVEWLPSVSSIVVVSPDTVATVAETVAALHQAGVKRLALAPNLDADWTASDWDRLQSTIYSIWPWPTVVHPFSDYLDDRYRMPECGFGVGQLSVSPAGYLYPCARLVGTDQRADLRIGHVSTGLDRERSSALRARNAGTLSGCGLEGSCLCLPSMPGRPAAVQLANHARFRAMVRRLSCTMS